MVATANTAAVSNATAAAGWDREVIFKRIFLAGQNRSTQWTEF
jgi:hypothetical protein